MTSAHPAPSWTDLAEHLGAPDADGTFSDFPDLLLASGRYYAYGQWRDSEHRLKVRLHRWGIGGISEPRGLADCTCEFWADQNWRTGRTPMLLSYPDLAAWIAEHATATGATEIVEMMNAARFLAALRT